MIKECIFDASVLLAILNNEKGCDFAEKFLSNAVMSTVNVAETIAEMEGRIGIEVDMAKIYGVCIC